MNYRSRTEAGREMSIGFEYSATRILITQGVNRVEHPLKRQSARNSRGDLGGRGRIILT